MIARVQDSPPMLFGLRPWPVTVIFSTKSIHS
jgi:hypothetical protein